jgi:hypothetical protein
MKSSSLDFICTQNKLIGYKRSLRTSMRKFQCWSSNSALWSTRKIEQWRTSPPWLWLLLKLSHSKKGLKEKMSKSMKSERVSFLQSALTKILTANISSIHQKSSKVLYKPNPDVRSLTKCNHRQECQLKTSKAKRVLIIKK